MYIAVAGNGTGRRYELRRTVKGPHGLAAERLLDLGKNPAGLIRFERAGIIYAPEVQEGLAGFDVDLDALDQAFSIFAPQGFTPPPSRKVWKRTVLTETEKDAIRAVPAFDRRRVAYLRSGEVNLSRIDEVNPRLFRRLPHQCRDEREHMFRRMEAELPRREIRRYIYAVFNLQRHFMDRAARNMPESLDPARLDEVFLHEFCLLWEDRIFDPHGEARESLRRYACMHFDFDFAPDDDFGRIFHEFMKTSGGSGRPGPRLRRIWSGNCSVWTWRISAACRERNSPAFSGRRPCRPIRTKAGITNISCFCWTPTDASSPPSRNRGRKAGLRAAITSAASNKSFFIFTFNRRSEDIHPLIIRTKDNFSRRF